MEAARLCIVQMVWRVNGLGDIIGINPKVEYAYHYNTTYMTFTYYDPNVGIISKIKI